MASKCFVVVLLAMLHNVKADYNFTLKMASSCKEHLSQAGYHYEPFYKVTDRNFEVGVAFEMHLAILAASNGHILLSPVEEPGLSDPVYEIVVGGGANKFSELRRMRRRAAKASERTPGILSPVDFRAFWIKVSVDGLVEFGREGESLPFLQYQDMDPLPVNYFSFASWTNVEAKFLYDCPVAGDDAKENVTNSEIVLPKLTTAQQLKVDLLGSRSPLTAPSARVTVKVGARVATVQYNAVESILDTTLGIVMTWQDDQITWNPDSYNGTTDLLFRQGEIWKPAFTVHNSASTGALQPRTSEPVYIVNSGTAVLHIRTKISTWCENTTSVFSAWPRDEYWCKIYIGPWEMHEQIHMEILEKTALANVENNNETTIITNGWEVLATKVRVTSYDVSPFTNITCKGDEYATQNSAVIIELNIRRMGAFNVVFYTPLITIIVFLLMSLWTEPLALSRIWFYCGTTVLLCAFISYIDTIVPSHKVPSIVVLYAVVLFTTLLAMVLQLLLSRPSLSFFISSGYRSHVTSHKCVRFLCCLPPFKAYRSFESDNEAFEDTENMDQPISSRSERAHTGNVEEMESEEPAKQPGPQYEVAAAVDKLLFAVYAVLYAALFALHY